MLAAKPDKAGKTRMGRTLMFVILATAAVRAFNIKVGLSEPPLFFLDSFFTCPEVTFTT
jgi:hypothetical protein